MKKLLSFILAVCTLLCVAACGNVGDPKSSKPQSTASVNEKEGVWQKGVYTNKWADIKITLSEFWTVTLGKDIPEDNNGKTTFDDTVTQWRDYKASNEAGEYIYVDFVRTDKSAVEYLEAEKQAAIAEAAKEMLTFDICQLTTTTVAEKEVDCLELFYSEEDGIEVLKVAIEGDGVLIVLTAYCTESGPYAIFKKFVTKA